MATEQESVTFERISMHPDYDISTTEPFIIRKRNNNKIMKQSRNNAGYLYVSINGKSYELHRLIAEQFIPNDDPTVKTDVDHIDSNKHNNSISNLQWISHTNNCKKRRKYKLQPNEYIDTLDGLDVVQITKYNNKAYDRYYYDKNNEKLYLKKSTKDQRSKAGAPIIKYKIVNPGIHGISIVTLISSNKEKTHIATTN